jgi:hypothetical protein
MPTLDDLPTLMSVVPTGDDLIPVFDRASGASSKVHTFPLNSVMGIAPTGQITSAAAGTATIATRVYVVNSGSGSTSSLTLPAASGALREVIVINGGSGAATVATLTAGSGTVAAAASARFLSNGTGWYRVG